MYCALSYDVARPAALKMDSCSKFAKERFELGSAAIEDSRLFDAHRGARRRRFFALASSCVFDVVIKCPRTCWSSTWVVDNVRERNLNVMEGELGCSGSC